jgi:hypothetical protein
MDPEPEIFMPFGNVDIDDPNDPNDPLSDVNPDLNLNNDPMLNLNTACNSQYYGDSDFSNMIANSMSDLKLLHLNIRSLPINNDALTIHFSTLNLQFHVIALTETWLTPETCDLSFLLPDYEHVKQYRVTKKGGGVSLFVHKSLSFNVLPELSMLNDAMESLFIEIPPASHSEKPVVIGVVYRPPNNNVTTFISDHLNAILSHPRILTKTCYIMGDFNVNLLNHASHNPTADFIDTLFAASFIPLINRPTRITQNSASLIDNIFSNTLPTQNAISGILTTDISDHLPIFHITRCTVKKHDSNNTTLIQPVLNDRTLNNMNRALLTQNWAEITECTDPQTAYSRFAYFLNEAYAAHIPQKHVQPKKARKPWLTKALLTSIKRKNKLYSIFLKYKTPQSQAFYKAYKNRLGNILRISEKKTTTRTNC